MKTKIVIISLCLLSLGVRLMAGGENISYVKTGSKVYFGTDIKMGLFNTRVIAPDGTMVQIHNHDIVAYMHDSKLFELMPLVNKSTKTTNYVMMEYITCRSGQRLYRCSSYERNNTESEYFVYKDGKLHLQIKQENAQAIFPFFGLKPL